MTIFKKRPADIDGADIKLLLDERTEESLKLEYKMNPWPNDREGSLEMLRDIISMANASGGYFVLGIEEDEQRTGVPKALSDIENADEEVGRIERRCLACIDPRISGLSVRSILVSDRERAVVIYIPRSPRKPHMLSYKGRGEFWKRHGTNKSMMSADEVREAVLHSEHIWREVSVFIGERRGQFLKSIGGAPSLRLYAVPSFVYEEVVNIYDPHIRKIVGGPPYRPFSQFFTCAENTRPCLEGLLSEPSKDKSYSFLISRNGSIEYRHRLNELLLREEEWKIVTSSGVVSAPSSEGFVIDPKSLEEHVLCFLDLAGTLTGLFGPPEPLLLGLGLHNIKDWHLGLRSDTAQQYFDDHLEIGPLSFQLSALPREAATVLLTRLWNAFGFWQCPIIAWPPQDPTC